MTPNPRLIAASASKTCKIVLPDPVAPRRSDMTARQLAIGTRTSSPFRVNPITTPWDVAHSPLRSLRHPYHRRTGVIGPIRFRARCARSPPARRSTRCRHAPPPTAARAHASEPIPARQPSSHANGATVTSGSPHVHDHPRPRITSISSRPMTTPPTANHAPVSTIRARCTTGSVDILELTTPCVIGTS
jgi:hypothetical protein